MSDASFMNTAGALEMWARTMGYFSNATANLNVDLPFPSTLFSGLQGDPRRRPSSYADEFMLEVGKLATLWREWEAAHPAGLESS